MDVKKAWDYLQNLFSGKYKGYKEFDLFYDAKTGQFFSDTTGKCFKKPKYGEIYLGCWSNKAEFSRFSLFIEEIRLRHSMYEVPELTPKAKDFVCNGAGPKGLGWTVPDFKFTDAANTHDLMYTVGGDSSDKKWADYCFLWNMKQAGSDWLAYLYFWAVRAFGKGAFEFRNRKMTIKEINESF